MKVFVSCTTSSGLATALDFIQDLWLGTLRSRDLDGLSPRMWPKTWNTAQTGPPRGQKYMEDKTPEESLWGGGLITAVIIGSLATSVTDIALY